MVNDFELDYDRQQVIEIYYFVYSELDELRYYLKTIEEFINKERFSIEMDFFKENLTNSVILQLISIIESYLDVICVIIGHKIHHIGYKTLKGGYIDKVRTFMLHSAKFTVLKDEWEKITTLYSIRHILIHNRGNISRSDVFESKFKKISAWIDKGIGLTTDNSFQEENLFIELKKE